MIKANIPIQLADEITEAVLKDWFCMLNNDMKRIEKKQEDSDDNLSDVDCENYQDFMRYRNAIDTVLEYCMESTEYQVFMHKMHGQTFHEVDAEPPSMEVG